MSTDSTFSPAELRRRRKRLGLASGQLARLFGVTVATIAHWESGRRRPVAPGMLELALRELERQAIEATEQPVRAPK